MSSCYTHNLGYECFLGHNGFRKALYPKAIAWRMSVFQFLYVLKEWTDRQNPDSGNMCVC